MPIWDEIIQGLKTTFTLSDIRNPAPRSAVCRECEIIGSAACFTATAYVWHQTRLGRLMPIPGMFITSILGAFSLALIFPPADDEVLKLWRQIQKEKLKQKQNREEEEKS